MALVGSSSLAGPSIWLTTEAKRFPLMPAKKSKRMSMQNHAGLVRCAMTSWKTRSQDRIPLAPKGHSRNALRDPLALLLTITLTLPASGIHLAFLSRHHWRREWAAL